MIEIFKITHNIYVEAVSPDLSFYARAGKGNNYKLVNHSFHYDLRKLFFLHVLQIVDASTVNAFKARLDKFWLHQAVKYDFTVDLTGTGNRSEEVLKSQSFY